MTTAKRIILRFPEDIQNPYDLYEPVRLYFAKFNRPVEELNSDRHWIHLQPPSDIPQANPKLHIVIDLETDEFSGPLGPGFPHELYRVRRQNNELVLGIYKDDVRENLLSKIRHYADHFYPWGQDRRSYLMEMREKATAMSGQGS
ncbi:hypothetical protein BJX70DRAFT_388632 [Aspergillus crustosus]